LGAGTAVSFVQQQFASAVPEPATWASMVLGLGLAGAGLRRRRRAAPFPA
jgi:hypothetical protein